MIQNIPVNIINYIDDKGKLVTNQVINKIQIRTADDLALLTTCNVGTRAYLADESKTWVYGADSQWYEVTGGSSSGGNGVLLVHQVGDGEHENIRLDKTWKEIFDAFTTSGAVVEVTDTYLQSIYMCNIAYVTEENGLYQVIIGSPDDDLYQIYTADGENDYPRVLSE